MSSGGFAMRSLMLAALAVVGMSAPRAIAADLPPNRLLQARAKLGFDAAALEAYAPEFQRRFELR